MVTPELVMKEVEQYSLTQAAVCIGTGGNPSEPEFSRWLRRLCELSPEALRRIEISLAALANICHDGYPWPLNWRSAEMIPIIRSYVKKQEKYRDEAARKDADEPQD